jgi:hypothetical protein
MPHAAQLVTSIEALTVVNQDQVCGVEAIVAVDLDKEIGRDVQARLEQRNAVVKHNQPAEVGTALSLMVESR